MAEAGSRIDWGGDNSPVRGNNGGSFSSLLSKNKAPRSHKNNNKDTGFVVKGGGSANQRTAAGLGGMHVTRVDRRVNTALNKNKQVTKGGGLPPIARIQAKLASVKVRPEN